MQPLEDYRRAHAIRVECGRRFRNTVPNRMPPPAPLNSFIDDEDWFNNDELQPKPDENHRCAQITFDLHLDTNY